MFSQSLPYNWRSARTISIAAITIQLVAALAPARSSFNVEEWRESVSQARESIAKKLGANTIQNELETAPLRPEDEIASATLLSNSASELQTLVASAHAAPVTSWSADENQIQRDKSLIRDLEALQRSLRWLERMHRSRATLARLEQEFSFRDLETDTLSLFWNGQRPWMSAELSALRQSTAASSPQLQLFLAAADRDLARLSQAASEIEIRHIDVWIEWASRQPTKNLPMMKQMAQDKVRRLERIKVNGPLFSKVQALDRDLRRMASVTSASNWE